MAARGPKNVQDRVNAKGRSGPQRRTLAASPFGWALAAAGSVIVLATVALGAAGMLAARDDGADRAGAPPAASVPSSPNFDPASVSPEPPAVNRTHVALVDLRTGKATPLPTSVRSIVGAANFRASPDGSRIAFDDGNSIYVASVDGTRLRRLTHGSDASITPMWSPDGTKIVYVVGREALSVVDVRTGVSATLLRLPREQLWLPGFSGNGRTILFTRTRDDGGWLELWTIPSRGGEQTRLLKRAAFGSYSPDGGAIAFHRVGHAVAPGTWPWNFGLSIVNADGSRSRRLTRSGCCTMAPLDWSWTRPAWSPSGSRIAYQRFGLTPGNIQVVDLASKAVAPAGTGALPSWFDDHTLIVADFKETRS